MKKILWMATAMAMLATTAQAETIKASVNGLVCSFCATAIEKTFNKQPSVEMIKVDLDNRLITINTKPDQGMDDTTVTKLITDAGYSVTGISRSK